jgi:hypothetical protein
MLGLPPFIIINSKIMRKIEESGLDKSLIQKIIDQAGQTDKDSVVIVNGESLSISKQQVQGAVADPDNCSSGKCDEVRSQINQICKSNNWPPRHPVLVCDPVTGSCCYCHCY